MPYKSLILFAFVVLLGGCHKPPAIEQLLQRVDALEQAVENKKIDTAIAMLTDDFTTDHNESRKDAKRLLLFYSLRHEQIHILRTHTDAEQDPVYPDRANVAFSVVVTGGHGLIPDQGRSYQVSSRWVYEDGDWYLNRLEWKPLL